MNKLSKVSEHVAFEEYLDLGRYVMPKGIVLRH